MKRPDGVTIEHLEYLDDLRESGDTNMYGAGEWLEDDFDINKKDARKVLKYWMKTFGQEDR